MTGFAAFEYGLSGKWLALLKEIAPGITRAAVLRDPAIAAGIGQLAAIQAVAPSLGVELTPLDLRRANELEHAVAEFARAPNGGVIVTAGPAANVHREQINTLMVRHRLPTVYPFRYYVERRRPRRLRSRYHRRVPTRGGLCRPHSAGRKTGQSGGADADEVRTGDQPQDRQGTRPRCPTNASGPRR